MFNIGDKVRCRISDDGIDDQVTQTVTEVKQIQLGPDELRQLIKTDHNEAWVGAGFFEHAGILPYLIKAEVVYTKYYNPDYGDNQLCKCGHAYVQHFQDGLPIPWCEDTLCFCKEFETK